MLHVTEHKTLRRRDPCSNWGNVDTDHIKQGAKGHAAEYHLLKKIKHSPIILGIKPSPESMAPSAIWSPKDTFREILIKI